MNGLTPIRTARLVAAMTAVIGMILVFVSRLLLAVVAMASSTVELALTRYSNFTGRFASRNFEEDKQLLAILKEVEPLLPTADTVLTIVFVLGIVVLLVALAGLAFPKQFVHVLVALKLLKWDNVEPMEGLLEDEGLPPMPLSKRAKIIIASSAGVFVLVVIIIATSGFSETREQMNITSAVNDMQDWAEGYINAQKAYFAKKNDIGGPKALQLPDTAQTEYFKYKVSGSRFTAESKVQMGNCPPGSKWYVSSSTKGFFTLDLVLYRAVPKDTACANLTPDFKNIGKHKKQKPAPADSTAKDAKAAKPDSTKKK